MSKRTRRKITLLSILFLLLVQATPGLAVCVCDVSEGADCCKRPAEPAQERSGCCAVPEPIERSSHCATRGMTTDEARLSVASTACQQAFASLDGSLATILPEGDAGRVRPAPPLVEFLPDAAPSTARSFPSLCSVRGSPPAASVPIFLLGASLLI